MPTIVDVLLHKTKKMNAQRETIEEKSKSTRSKTALFGRFVHEWLSENEARPLRQAIRSKTDVPQNLQIDKIRLLPDREDLVCVWQ